MITPLSGTSGAPVFAAVTCVPGTASAVAVGVKGTATAVAVGVAGTAVAVGVEGTATAVAVGETAEAEFAVCELPEAGSATTGADADV